VLDRSDWRDDGPDTLVDSKGSGRAPGLLFKRGKRHDYFTSCLPWPQKGTAQSITSAPTITANGSFTMTDGTTTQAIEGAVGGTPVIGGANWTGGALSYSSGLQASAATETINDLRLAFQTQRLLERDARSGTRYNEVILAHFGVTVPDFRVQRPEFLGGGSSPVNISPVANTSGSSGDLGDLAAFGTVSGSHGFTKSFVEHGVLIGLVNVRGDITYSQGIERYWSKQTRYDFYYPVLAHIGEQTVLNQEIYAETAGSPTGVFGYQERYAEYRYKPSRLTNLMSVDATGTLEAWHLSEEFTSAPTLGDSFIQSNTGTPLDRAIAVPSEPHFIFDAFFDMKCARPMPLYGVPGNLDHF
jgi:hypothetical protein